MANREMEFEYNNVHYKLGFNKSTVRQLEQRGFDATKLQNLPATMIQLLWQGAFLKNHKRTPQSTIEDIWNHLENRNDVIIKLVELYSEPLAGIVEDLEDTGEDSKNFKIDTNW